MSQGSQDISQQFIGGGVIPGQLVGQDAVSKTYVDGQNAGLSGNISAVAASAAAAQGAINSHEASATAHSAAAITYSGAVAASNVRQAIDQTDQRVSTIVAGAGASNTEILDARQPAAGAPFPILGARLNNVDAQLADTAEQILESPKLGYLSTSIATWKDRFEMIEVNVKDFGAVGDGLTHPLSGYFASLAAAQAVYPHVTSLTQEVDWAAIQAALNYSSKVFVPEGIYCTSDPLVYSKNNLRLIGHNATIIGDTALLSPKPYSQFVGDTLMTNITVQGFTFKTRTLAFNESGRVVRIAGVDGFLLENCNFVGWNGDAITIDIVYGDTEFVYLNAVTRNVTVRNCSFDGINCENRQGVTIFQGTEILIEKCSFKNTTKAGMPGAIDLEPWQYHTTMKIIENVKIRDNSFYNIHGDGGAVNLYFEQKQSDLTYPLRNIEITNNVFSECYGPFIYFNQRNSTDTTWSANNITVKSNTFNGSMVARWQSISFFGMRGVDVSDNDFNNYHGVSFLGKHNDIPNSTKNIDFRLSGNKFNNLSPSSTTAWKPIIELGLNDTFIADGNIVTADDALYSAYLYIIVFRLIPPVTGTPMINLVFKNNIVRNSGAKRIFIFFNDTNNSNLTAAVMLNNIMGSTITEHAI